jgi:hypothetical protein
MHMNLAGRAHFRTPISISSSVSLTGFALLLVYGVINNLTDASFSRSTTGLVLLWISVGLTVFGLIVCLPLELLLRRPTAPTEVEVDESQLPASRRVLLKAVHGGLPKFVYYPVLAIAYTLGAVFVIGIIVVVVLIVRSWP